MSDDIKDGARTRARRPLWQHMLCHWADAIVYGRLTLQFSDGHRHVNPGRHPGPAATLRFNNSRGFRQILTGGGMGFARAYMDGNIDTPDLDAVFALTLANEAHWRSVLGQSRFVSLFNRIRHRLRRNSRSGSRRNIAFHYDLGNAFYRQWLDETMTYSSALFRNGATTLAAAQTAKYDRIVRRLDIGPDDHVLEIGCGWGGFAERAIETTGCRVTGLTLSKEQAHYARDRLDRRGLAERADIRLEDYRDCKGQFTKVVSIEMFEAVGEENWPHYFQRVRDLLVPGGRGLVQAITIDETMFEDYRRHPDFIQTYIFPGGMLPSKRAFTHAANAAGLAITDAFCFGADYAKTLAAWEKRFLAAWDRIAPLGFDERFRRMWLYYLAYCNIGFRDGRLDVAQFELAPR